MGLNSYLLKMIEDAEAHERARQERIAALVALCEELLDHPDFQYPTDEYRERLARLKGEG